MFGRLDDGRPFCCLASDIEILDFEDSQSKTSDNVVGHDESKALNKTFSFFVCCWDVQ